MPDVQLQENREAAYDPSAYSRTSRGHLTRMTAPENEEEAPEGASDLVKLLCA